MNVAPLVLLCVMTIAGRGQTAVVGAPPAGDGAPGVVTSIQFGFEPRVPGEKPWSILVNQQGEGTLRSSDGTAVRNIHVGKPTLELLEEGRDAVAENRCESKLKNVAQTGAKKVTYAVGASVASCTFNYSDDSGLNRSADTFRALETTLEMGDELARLHRFDRLGLDAEMDTLQSSADRGFALEVENISPVLQSIVDDERVMERVRVKASRLLAGAKAE